MDISENLYGRILDGIDDVIKHALTRRKGDGVSVGGGEVISMPGEPSAYGKHSKDWYAIRDFVAAGRDISTEGKFDALPDDLRGWLLRLPERIDVLDDETRDEYLQSGLMEMTMVVVRKKIEDMIQNPLIVDDEDADYVCRLYANPQIRPYLRGWFKPLFDRDITDMSDIFGKRMRQMEWMEMIEPDSALAFDMTVIDKNGMEMPICELDLKRNDDIVFVRFNSHKWKSECEIVIRKDSMTRTHKACWEDAVREADGEIVRLPGMTAYGFLPDKDDMGRFRDFREVIDEALTVVGGKPVGNDTSLWTSDEDGEKDDTALWLHARAIRQMWKRVETNFIPFFSVEIFLTEKEIAALFAAIFHMINIRKVNFRKC